MEVSFKESYQFWYDTMLNRWIQSWIYFKKLGVHLVQVSNQIFEVLS